METALRIRDEVSIPDELGIETPPLPDTVAALLAARTADAVFVVDPEYRVVHWDLQMEALTGLFADEVLGGHFEEALAGQCGDGTSFAARERQAMRLARLGSSYPSYDMSISARTSGRRWVNASTLIVDTEDGPYLIHLLHDVQELHDTLEMARALIRLSPDGTSPARQAREAPNIPQLTPRQFEMLQLLASGRSVKEIGRELYLSQATVRNHVRALLQALGVHSQLEAVVKARRVGLLTQ